MAQLEEDLSVSPGPHEKPGRYPHVIPHKGGRDRGSVSLPYFGMFQVSERPCLKNKRWTAPEE